MEKIYNYIFTTQLTVDPSERNVIITEVSMNPKVNRVKMAHIMFETLEVWVYMLPIQLSYLYFPPVNLQVLLWIQEKVFLNLLLFLMVVCFLTQYYKNEFKWRRCY